MIYDLTKQADIDPTGKLDSTGGIARVLYLAWKTQEPCRFKGEQGQYLISGSFRVAFPMLDVVDVNLVADVSQGAFLPVWVEPVGPYSPARTPINGFNFRRSSITLRGSALGAGFQMGMLQLNQVIGAHVTGCVLNGDAGRENACTDGIVLGEGSTDCIVECCWVNDCSKAGVYEAMGQRNHFRDLWIANTRSGINQYGAGIVTNNAQDSKYEGITINGARGTGQWKGIGVLLLDERQTDFNWNLSYTNMRIMDCDGIGFWANGSCKKVRGQGIVTGSHMVSRVELTAEADVLDLINGAA